MCSSPPLRQAKGVFSDAVLAVFVYHNVAFTCRSYRESLGEIFTVVLEAVLEAEPGSMYAGINTSNVVDFLLHLTKPVQDVSI